MKRKHLKPWVQDMLMVSVFAKIGFLCMVADITLSFTTALILGYVLISAMAETWLLSKYELRVTKLFEGK